MKTKLIYLLSLMMFSFGGLAIALNHHGFALKVITYSFWTFCLGTFLYIWEVKNDEQ